MIPLWTTATRPVLCGWAFVSEGRPWVAHRVCPTPQLPAIGWRETRSVRRESFPSLLRMSIRPPSRIATPAESYPRYSSLRSPSSRISPHGLGPVYPTIPHMLRFLLTRPLLFSRGDLDPRLLEKFRHPADHPPLDHLLLRPGEGEGEGGDILRDRGPRADQGPLPDRHRGDELGVAADEDPVPDHGPVLGEPVVVAGDRPGADVRLPADRRVADVGEVVRLRALPEPALLHLHEIDDPDILADVGLRPQVREGTEHRSLPDAGIRE